MPGGVDEEDAGEGEGEPHCFDEVAESLDDGRSRDDARTDGLSDVSCFGCDDVALSYGIEDAALAVVDVAEDGNDGAAKCHCSRQETCRVFKRSFFLVSVIVFDARYFRRVLLARVVDWSTFRTRSRRR